LRQVAVEHVDAGKVQLAHEFRRRDGAHSDRVIRRVLSSHQPELVAEITDVELAATARSAMDFEHLRELGMASYLVVPLLIRGRALGVISLMYRLSGRRYGPQGLALAEDLADRAALAIDNALLYEETREALRTRDEFLAAAAHDLKAPLACIKGTSQLLRRHAARTEGPNRERLTQGLATIDATAPRMSQTVGTTGADTYD
jgi:GAF domain-containing protein